MKLHSVTDDKVSSHGIVEENQYTIVASAKAFKILSSSLYKNKILAVIRELSCNAYDAHIDNGNEDEPFEIKLPTQLDSNFKIRDYGIGLSHEDVMDIYTTYFASTKTNSNKPIGGLGLGSKSPFSYTSSFNINSYFNGISRLYSAYLDDNGMPQIALMITIPTTERNGLEISFAVKDSDARSFKNNTDIALKHFLVKPIFLCGYTLDSRIYDIDISNDDWKIFNSGNRPVAVQGSVEYPIILKNIKNIPSNLIYFEKLALEIHFQIGDLDVAASREDLSYDNLTCEILIKKLKQIDSYLKRQIKKQIDDCSTYWEAQSKYNEIINSYGAYRVVIQSMSITYDDTIISKKSSIDLTDSLKDKNVQFYIYGEKPSGQSTVSRMWLRDSIVKIDNKTSIIFNDLSTKFLSRIKYHYETSKCCRIYEFKISKDYDQSVIDGIIKELCNPPYIMLSDVILPKKEKTIQNLNIPMFNKHQGIFNNEYYDEEELDDLDDNMYYVKLSGKVLMEGICNSALGKIIQSAINLKIIKNTDTIYGFQKSIFKIIDCTKHIDLIDFIKKEVVKLTKDKELKELLKLQHSTLLHPNSYFYTALDEILKDNKITDHDYIKMLENFKMFKKFNVNNSILNIVRIGDILKLKFSIKKYADYTNLVYEKYPLLHRLKEYKSWDNKNEEDIFSEFQEYVENKYQKTLS